MKKTSALDSLLALYKKVLAGQATQEERVRALHVFNKGLSFLDAQLGGMIDAIKEEDARDSLKKSKKKT